VVRPSQNRLARSQNRLAPSYWNNVWAIWAFRSRTETTFGPLGHANPHWTNLAPHGTKKKESLTPTHRNLDDHDYDTYSATIRFQKEIWTTTKSGRINKTILPPPEIQLRPEKHFHSSTGDTISTRKTIFCRYHLTISQRRLLSDDLTPSQTSVAAVFVAVVSLQLQRLPTKLRCRCRLVGESTHATTKVSKTRINQPR
jgi:hypothetical protein